LAVVAALGVWQLVRYGGPVTEQAGTSGQGGRALGVDPFIVAGPALALLAGGALVLRIVPIAARAAERMTSRREAIAPALGAWQVSRRPLRYTGPALLLVMAIAVGVLSVTAGVTWRRPVLRKPASAGDQDVTLLAADTAKTGALLRTPPTAALGAAPPSAAPQAGTDQGAPPGATAQGGAPPAVALPGRADRLTLDVRIVPHGALRDPGQVERGRLSALVVDAFGVVGRVEIGGVPGDGRFHSRAADLAALAGQGGRLSPPIAIRGFRYDYAADAALPPLTLSLRVGGDSAAEPGLRPPVGGAWSSAFRQAGGTSGGSGGGSEPDGAAVRPDATLLTIELPKVKPAGDRFGAAMRARLTVVLGRSGERAADGAPPLPGIITAELAKRAGLGVGGRLTLTEPYGPQPVTVAGIVPALPSTAPNEPAVLVDWRAYADRSTVLTGTDTAPTEWWLATRGDTGPAARTLAGHPAWTTAVVDRMALRRELRDAPLGAALQGAFVLGFLAALGLAVVGFAVNAAVSARERRAEFAVLRALGVSTRQVFGMLGVEQAFLVVLGLAGGLALGLVIGHVVIPHTVLTVRATAPYPPVRLVVPWPSVIGLLAGVPALLAVVLALLVRALRRRGLGSAVRIGEDR
jgi:hypothetical protein